jgi:hypothetical protein
LLARAVVGLELLAVQRVLLVRVLAVRREQVVMRQQILVRVVAVQQAQL